MAVSIKEEGLLLLQPSADFVSHNSHFEVSENLELPENYEIVEREELETEEEDAISVEKSELNRPKGPPADIELEKLPRPSSALNCRQARSYLVKLLRAANGGQNPQYGNPNSKPPFWPDFYWPWSKLTDVHTKPRGMEEPLLYSEMMKLAIQRGYKYYGYDPETYWDKTVEEKEPTPVERGTPAPILTHQVENLGLPPKLPRPNSKLNCVQARTVLSKLLRYQQAGNNPVYGHPETRPPWWPDECIRWLDMVDLRGKPPYLPPDMTYTDVLKHAIEKGLKFFGYDSETWIDNAQYSREINHSLLAKKPVASASENPCDGPPKLPIPINKMNCGLARTTLSRLLRFHCGKNPKYGTLTSMPVWWPNDVFEWTALKNLSHRYDGNLGDSYSNCLRLAIVQGYEFYGKDPYGYVEETGDDLPTVAAIKRIKLMMNPQVSEMIQQFDDDIADDPDQVESISFSDETFELDTVMDLKNGIIPINEDNNCSIEGLVKETKKRPPPALISISDISSFEGLSPKSPERSNFNFGTLEPQKKVEAVSPGKKRKTEGQFAPLISARANVESGTKQALKRCRVDVSRLGLDQIEHAQLSETDIISIAKSEYDLIFFNKLKNSYDRDTFCDFEMVFSDGRIRVHRLILAAGSNFLSDLLQDQSRDCLVFPDLTLAEGKTAVEALYTGNVIINRKSAMSLNSIERCVRAFQEVGLLENYSIQISAPLPLSNFKSTRPMDIRTQSPPPPKTEISKNVEVQNFLEKVNLNETKDVGNEQMDVNDSSDQPDPVCKLSEPNDCILSDTEYESEIEGPKENFEPIIEAENCIEKRKSPTKFAFMNGRNVCNKPRFHEISTEALKFRSSLGQKEVINWLMEIGFLCSTPPDCKGCGDQATLQSTPDTVDTLTWKCPAKEKCYLGPSTPSLLREHSIFQFSKESLTWILRIILCWRENTSLSNCHQETGASVDAIFFWYEKCRQFFGLLDEDSSE